MALAGLGVVFQGNHAARLGGAIEVGACYGDWFLRVLDRKFWEGLLNKVEGGVGISEKMDVDLETEL